MDDAARTKKFQFACRSHTLGTVRMTASLRHSGSSLLEHINPLSRRNSSSKKGHQMRFSWGRGTPRLVVTGDTEDFDPTSIQHYRDEGFAVTYLPYNGTAKDYKFELQSLEDPLELGDTYAIVAYGSAAALVLDACTKPMPKLCAVVAYYPEWLPNASGGYPSSLHIKIHLAGTQNFKAKYHCFTYVNSDVGFAEHDRDQFDEISARLAWSRTLACLREGFEMPVDLEPAWEKHVHYKYAAKDVDGLMSTLADKPYVNYVPVMNGGFGYDELRRFYAESFIPSNPPSLKLRLICRTVGTDHVVDEIYISFRHTQEVPWMLPGVPPTDKQVEVALVSVVGIRGGKLCHENIYWDQASVLVQLGLLDPKYIPPSFKAASGDGRGGGSSSIERLPVVGAESAKKVLDEQSVRSNQLLHGEK